MKRALALCLGTAICLAPLIGAAAPKAQTAVQTKAKAPALATAKAAAPKAAATKAGAYHAPRNAFGQPDISIVWTNASITGETRPAGVANLVYTEAEARALEGEVKTEVDAGNRPTDPNAPVYAKGGTPLEEGIRTRYTGSLASGTGAYNRGWLDPGASVMRVNGQPRSSFLTTPDGRPPARKTAAAVAVRGINTEGGENEDAAPARGPRGGAGAAAAGAGAGRGGAGGVGRVANTRANPEEWPVSERCMISFGRNAGPPMFPNGFYNNNYGFVQGKDSVAIWVEMVHDVRVVHLNAKHRTDGVRPWFGDSIGHYEGDTLVVETTNIPQAQAYNGSWQTLTITEKFTRVSPTRMHYQYIIHDPVAWDSDWGGEYEFSSLPPGQGIYEYACHEGNYALEDMLAGARAEDRARAAAATATTPVSVTR